MLACCNCFSSTSLQELIAARGVEATCSLCGAENLRCLSAESLATVFAKLVGHYKYGALKDRLLDPADTRSPAPGIPSLSIVTLAQRIREDGLHVFAPSLSENVCNVWLDAVRAEDDRSAHPAMGRWVSSGLGLADRNWWKGTPSDDWIGWLAFSRFVKHHSRFVIDFERGGIPNYPALLQTSNPALIHLINTGTLFYRARMHCSAMGSDVPSDQEMGAPSSEKAKAGRANASGISVLYVGDVAATSLYVMRPAKGAIVHLARCRAKSDLKIFDFTAYPRVRGLDPFAAEFESHVKTASTLAILNDEYARPVAPHTPDRDYAPTQHIAELIHSCGYDGIRYRSAMAPEGVNYAFFDPKKLEIRFDRSVKITGIRVEWVDHVSAWSALSEDGNMGRTSVG